MTFLSSDVPSAPAAFRHASHGGGSARAPDWGDTAGSPNARSAHLNQMRRFAVRYEQRADIYTAFLTLGCTLLAFHHLARFCESVRRLLC